MRLHLGVRLFQCRSALAQSLFRTFSLRNVANNAHEKLFAAGPGLGYREVHWKNGAVFSQAECLAAYADNPLFASREIAREVAVVILAIGRRHKHLDIFSDELGGLVAKELFPSGVDRLNQAEFVDADDAIDGRFEQGMNAHLTHSQGFIDAIHALPSFGFEGAKFSPDWFPIRKNPASQTDAGRLAMCSNVPALSGTAQSSQGTETRFGCQR